MILLKLLYKAMVSNAGGAAEVLPCPQTRAYLNYLSVQPPNPYSFLEFCLYSLFF